MPLILAIVADPHEAAQLAKLIQGRLSVDLVQAAEVGEGLLALNDRLPDLVLTSPLMSPFDDGVLDEYLRGLGPAGAHVQTVRIPVLSEAPKKKPRFGFSFGRSKPEPVTPEGCEPKVFADEIQHYLERAAEEKRHAASSGSSPAIEVEESTPTSPIEEQWTPAYSDDSTPVYSSEAAPVYTASEQAMWRTEPVPEPEPDHSAWRSDLLDKFPFAEEPANEVDNLRTAPTWTEETEQIELESQAPVIEASTLDAALEPLEGSAIEASPIAGLEIVDEAAVEEPVADESLVEKPALDEPGEEVYLQSEMPAEVTAHVAVPREPDTTIYPADKDVAAESSPSPVTTQDTASGSSAPTGRDARAIKATPSFKAALAAIRAAWGKPTRTTGQDNVGTVDEHQPTSTPIVSSQVTDDLESESGAPIPEVTAPVEVDLTGAVEMLDDPQPESTMVPGPPQPREPAKRRAVSPDAEDVYELSVDPDLPELEAKFFAPLAPARTREAASPIAEPQVDETSRSTQREESSGRRHMNKKPGSKGAKAKAARSEPQTEDVQDEWGMFDPNRCGFAAVVDKLDEVAEKKEQPPQRGKVRLISYS
jgi:hypothetical protein